MLNDKFRILLSLTTLIAFIVLSIPAHAADGYVNKLIIDYKKTDITISLEYNGERLNAESDCNRISYSADEITLNHTLKFTPAGISWGDISIPFDLLKQTELQKISKDRIYIEFQILDTAPQRRIPRDIINAFEPLSIDSEQFVRGYVLNVGSDVDVYGEVSENIFCLFGNIILHSNSLVRNDAIAICGRVISHENSQVYGQIISQEGLKKGERKFKPSRYYKALSIGADIDYNRVDGLFLEPLIEFRDNQQIIPSFRLGIGYAFTAERLRYLFEVSQKIFKYYTLEPHAALYRKTATEDDWICGQYENMAFVLIAKEDFRDYFERQGGSIGIKGSIGPDNSIDLQYSNDDIDWMNSHPLLWGLFGPDRFRRNWSSIPEDSLEQHLSDFYSRLSLIRVTYIFDNLNNNYDPPVGWQGSVEFEKAGGSLGGDLKFSRWWITGIRYQPINRYLGLKFRAMYGGSHGRLPIFKKFFLGGIRTLYGYDIKEFYGDQMFLANAEYLINFGVSSLRGKIFFDIGNVVGQDDNIFKDGEFKSDVGIGFGFSSDIQIMLAKALDRSDSDIKVWVQFARSF